MDTQLCVTIQHYKLITNVVHILSYMSVIPRIHIFLFDVSFACSAAALLPVVF